MYPTDAEFPTPWKIVHSHTIRAIQHLFHSTDRATILKSMITHWPIEFGDSLSQFPLVQSNEFPCLNSIRQKFHCIHQLALLNFWNLIAISKYQYIQYNSKDDYMLTLFISYSHKDKEDRASFMTHLAPFVKNRDIDPWFDGMNGPGCSFMERISTEMARADIFCLLISPDYLNSNSCMDELEYSISQASNQVIVIPIILRACSWTAVPGIRDLLALPEDGKPIAAHDQSDAAWKYVCGKIMAEVKRNSYPSVAPDFLRWKNETEITAVLSGTRELALNDLFVDVDLDVLNIIDGNVTSKTSYSDFASSLCEDDFRAVVSGAQQSGKTTLLKKIHSHYVELQICIPIYIDVEPLKGAVNFQKQCLDKLRDQFDDVDNRKMTNWKQILLLDNFHKASTKLQRKLVEDLLALENLAGVILVVDEIYNLGVTENLVTAGFAHYRIKPLGYKRRDELVCNWMRLNERDPAGDTKYRDAMASKIDTVRQKAVLPASPFFIYSIIASYESTSPLSNEITSQGHCYQALIYLALKKAGVKEGHIDSYTNLLSELAHEVYQSGKTDLSEREYEAFIVQYKSVYTLPMSDKELRKILISSRLINISQLRSVAFTFPYIFYYFMGKYLCDHLKEPLTLDLVTKIMEKLHIEKNGYIIVFLIHHTRDYELLQKLAVNLKGHYQGFNEATLGDNEIHDLNGYSKELQPIVIGKVIDTEENRTRLLKTKDAAEDDDDEGPDLEIDSPMSQLRSAIKTVEVMGQILKNRVGSIKTSELEAYMDDSLRVFLRITGYFTERFKMQHESFIQLIVSIVSSMVEESGRYIGETELKAMANKQFFEHSLMNYITVIKRTASSLCSAELIPIMEVVSHRIGSPLATLIYRQCTMTHDKHIDVSLLKNDVKNMNELEKRVLSILIVEHCYMNKVDFKDRQKIARILGLNEQSLTIATATKV